MALFAIMPVVAFLAAGMAIPFGQPPGGAPEPRPMAKPARYVMAFEFVEEQKGFTLNALVQDRARPIVHSTPISHCRSIDIESVTDGLFGHPVRCDGIVYAFDVRHLAIFVDPQLPGGRAIRASSGRARSKVIHRVNPGPAVFNGVPLLME